MPPPIAQARGVLRHTVQAFAYGMRTGAGAAPHPPASSLHFTPRRGFQRLPRLDDKEFAPLVLHLDAVRVKATLADAEPLEFLQGQGLGLPSLHANSQAWQQVRIPVNVTSDSGNVTGIPVNVTEGRCCAL